MWFIGCFGDSSYELGVDWASELLLVIIPPENNVREVVKIGIMLPLPEPKIYCSSLFLFGNLKHAKCK